MPKGGVEPPTLAGLRPERSVYANFTTSAQHFYKGFYGSCAEVVDPQLFPGRFKGSWVYTTGRDFYEQIFYNANKLLTQV
jgi:hypothetical protein